MVWIIYTNEPEAATINNKTNDEMKAYSSKFSLVTFSVLDLKSLLKPMDYVLNIKLYFIII